MFRSFFCVNKNLLQNQRQLVIKKSVYRVNTSVRFSGKLSKTIYKSSITQSCGLAHAKDAGLIPFFFQ